MEDWIDDTEEDKLLYSGSESSNEDVESELYSVLHYNSFSEDIPQELLEKYDIKRNDKNEFYISFKKPEVSQEREDISNTYPSPELCSGSMNQDQEQIVVLNKELTTSDTLPLLVSSEILSPPCKEKNVTVSDDSIVNTLTSPGSSNLQPKSKRKKKAKSTKERGRSLQLEVVTCSLENKTDIILISDDSDSEDGSDVILQEPHIDTTVISSSSSVECLSDSNPCDNNMILNTSRTSSSVFPVDDKEEEEEIFKYDWKSVPSPSTWTERMKRYYNRPSKKLRTFNFEKVLEEIRGKGGPWNICHDDMFPSKKKYQLRCNFCRSPDHKIRDCPKRFSNCSVCGEPGHAANWCPQRMCLNCGEQLGMFVSCCRKCERNRHKRCDECNQTGHIRQHCPDVWRRYHLTTSGNISQEPATLNEKSMCCNCGKAGHLFENCNQLYWSSYAPTSFLIQKCSEPNFLSGKRSYSQTNSVTGDFTRNKKARYSEPSSFPNRSYSNQDSGTPGYSNDYLNNSFPRPNSSQHKKKGNHRYFMNNIDDVRISLNVNQKSPGSKRNKKKSLNVKKREKNKKKKKQNERSQ